MSKRILLLLMTISILFSLSACYDSKEIDGQVYALAIGIDKGTTNAVRLSVQYATYTEGGGGGGMKGTEENKHQQEGSIVHTIESPTLLQALDLFGMSISRRVSFLHAKYLIISEELAKDDVERYIYAMLRYHETRPNMFIIVSKGKAEDFLLNNSTFVGSTLSKSMDLFANQPDYMGYFSKITLHDFALMATFHGAPIAIYAGVNDFKALDKEGEQSDENASKDIGKFESVEVANREDSAENNSGDKGILPDYTAGYSPGELPRKGAVKREFVGIAVFRNNKMVGNLNSYETLLYHIATNQSKNSTFSFKDKHSSNEYDAIVVNLRSNGSKTEAHVDDNGDVTINHTLSIEGDIESIQSGISYESVDMMMELNKMISETLTEEITKLVEKTQKEFRSDIFDFGKTLCGNFLTIQDWENFNWRDKYEQAKINVFINVNVRRTGLIIKSN